MSSRLRSWLHRPVPRAGAPTRRGDLHARLAALLLPSWNSAFSFPSRLHELHSWSCLFVIFQKLQAQKLNLKKSFTQYFPMTFEQNAAKIQSIVGHLGWSVQSRLSYRLRYATSLVDRKENFVIRLWHVCACVKHDYAASISTGGPPELVRTQVQTRYVPLPSPSTFLLHRFSV